MASYRKENGSGRALCVLLVEDDAADAYLTKRSLMALPQVKSVVHRHNGKEAIAYS